MQSRHFEVIAHRGLHARARENTLAAFEEAISAGADALELDVHASSDGIVVVHHDAAIGMADGKTVSIAELPADGVREAARNAKFEISTLDEVLNAVAGRAKLYIEVKAPGIELIVARIVRASEFPLAVHSFDHRIVKTIRGFVPGIQTGVLTVSRPMNPANILFDAAANDYWPQVDFVDGDLVAEVHDAGGRVIVWTANRPDQWERLARLNVDGICTDRPDQLRAWLG